MDDEILDSKRSNYLHPITENKEESKTETAAVINKNTYRSMQSNISLNSASQDLKINNMNSIRNADSQMSSFPLNQTSFKKKKPILQGSSIKAEDEFFSSEEDKGTKILLEENKAQS